MKINPIKTLYFVALIFSFLGCNKDGIDKRSGEAFPSFDNNTWLFEDVEFADEKNGTIAIQLYKQENPNVKLEVVIIHIEPVEGSSVLLHGKAGGSINYPTAYMFVIEGDDTLGEWYEIDSTMTTESFINIDCINKNKISGQFQINFVKSEYPFPKVAPWIPDSFSLLEGKFDARRN